MDREQVTVGMEVLVHPKPLVIGGREFPRKAYRAKVRSLTHDATGQPYENGCVVISYRGAFVFVRWDEIKPAHETPTQQEATRRDEFVQSSRSDAARKAWETRRARAGA